MRPASPPERSPTVPALNFSSPGDSCSATQNVATNGNAANCRQIISSTISGVTIPNGQSFWIRWTDVDTGGSDDGVAIDDFSISVTTSTISISPTATGSASPEPRRPGSADDAERDDHARPEPDVGELRGGVQSHVDWRIRDAVVAR